MKHLVVAPTISRRMSVMKEGTRSQCLTYIKQRVRQNMPTHFCYIVRDTFRAIDNFKRRHDLT